MVPRGTSSERTSHTPKPDLVPRKNLLLGLCIRFVEQKVLNVITEARALAEEELAHGVRHLRRQNEHHRVPVDLLPLASAGTVDSDAAKHLPGKHLRTFGNFGIQCDCVHLQHGCCAEAFEKQC